MFFDNLFFPIILFYDKIFSHNPVLGRKKLLSKFIDGILRTFVYQHVNQIQV